MPSQKVVRVSASKQIVDQVKHDKLAPEYVSIIDRLIQNRQDPAQWMKTNVKTIDQAKGIIDFKIYQFQESILNIFFQAIIRAISTTLHSDAA